MSNDTDSQQQKCTYTWCVMLVLVLDIETTGLSQTSDCITVIGTIVYNSLDNKTISEKCYNVVVAEESADAQDIVTMKQDIARLLDDAECVVAFNGINFDMPFIVKWLHSSATEIHASDALDALGKRKTPPIDTAAKLRTISQSGASVGADRDRWKHKYLDFCRLSKDYTGAYISLHNACLRNKITVAKSGSGLQAIEWAKDKKWDLLESYCMQDVVVLLALTQHAVGSGLTLPVKGYGKRKATQTDSIVLCFDTAMQPFVRESQDVYGAIHKDIFDPSSPNALNFDKRGS